MTKHDDVAYGVKLNPPIIIGFPQITPHPIILLECCCTTITGNPDTYMIPNDNNLSILNLSLTKHEDVAYGVKLNPPIIIGSPQITPHLIIVLDANAAV